VALLPWVVTAQTKHVDDLDSDVVEWNEEFELKVPKQPKTQTEEMKLLVQVWDEDVGMDDLVGQGYIEADVMDQVVKSNGDWIECKADLFNPLADDAFCGTITLRLAYEASPATNRLAPVDKPTAVNPKLKLSHRQLSTRLAQRIQGEDATRGILKVVVASGKQLRSISKEVTSVHQDRSIRFKMASLITVHLLGGALIFHLIEDITFLESLYYCVVTLMTVGYGDILPKTTAGKLVACIYCYFGILIVSSSAGYLLSAMMVSLQSQQKNALSKAKREKSAREKGRRIKETSQSQGKTQRATFFRAFLLWVLVQIVGVLTFMNTPDSLGGPEKSFLGTFYVLCVSLTSVGYGDFSPSTDDARLFSIFWLFWGALVTGKMVSTLVELFFASRQRHLEKRVLEQLKQSSTYDNVKKMDRDNSGKVNEAEFILHMLVKLGKVDDIVRKDIQHRFKELDVTGDGFISQDDLKAEQMEPGDQEHTPVTEISKDSTTAGTLDVETML